MEEKINIAKILKDKPKGTKLYSDICCGECVLNEVSENAIYVDMYNKERFWYFSVYGTIYAFPDGGVLLYPSYEMRDWRKFAWKKGDVLVNKDGNVHIIFDGFEDDTYKNFHGKNYLWEEGGSIVNFEEDEDYIQTSDFNKANKEDAQEYIHKIEKELGGKLNRETLEIEKAQPEFKDGDIVCISGMGYLAYGIVKSIDYSSKKLEYYVLNDMSTLKFEDWLSFEDKQIQPITETQQIILFDALTKKNKAWDTEKKEVVDLKPKVELKPFDKVLCRNSKDDTWEADFFARLTRKEIDYTQSGKYLCVGDLWMYCIPYNEETAHLLGTTDEWKGGEG